MEFGSPGKKVFKTHGNFFIIALNIIFSMYLTVIKVECLDDINSICRMLTHVMSDALPTPRIAVSVGSSIGDNISAAS